jgi:hypothetical protein
MIDFWSTPDGAHERDGNVFPPNALPKLLPGEVLELSQHDEINSDLLYRLEIQLSQIAMDEGPKEKGDARAGRNAALRIRQRKPSLMSMSEGGGWI